MFGKLRIYSYSTSTIFHNFLHEILVESLLKPTWCGIKRPFALPYHLSTLASRWWVGGLRLRRGDWLAGGKCTVVFAHTSCWESGISYLLCLGVRNSSFVLSVADTTTNNSFALSLFFSTLMREKDILIG